MEGLYTVGKRVIIFCEQPIIEHPNANNAIFYGKIVQDLGYEVKVIGIDYFTGCSRKFIKYDVECENIACEGKINFLSRKRQCVRKGKDIIDKYFGNDVFIAFFLGDIAGILYHYLFHKCKKNNSALIVQMCEWYDVKRTFAGCTWKNIIKKLVFYIAVVLARNINFVKANGIIAISSSMAACFNNKKCKTMVMPNLLDTELLRDQVLDHKKNDKLVLGYFGSPGLHNTKDSLDNIIYALNMLGNDEREKIDFYVYGIEERELTSKYDVEKSCVDNLKNVLKVFGRIPKDQVGFELAKVDFTVLLRNNTHSINCGLSSKMEESLAYGVPVICNITSDMDKYIVNGKSGIIVEKNTPESCLLGIRKALMLTQQEKNSMRNEALNKADELINYRRYVNQLGNFMEEIQKNE